MTSGEIYTCLTHLMVDGMGLQLSSSKTAWEVSIRRGIVMVPLPNHRADDKAEVRFGAR